jgi:DNA-binding GntR family transcriptional regulator
MSDRNEIYHKLKKAIIYGELSPGEKLSEISLAKNLNTSRTPIREAFRQLQAEGFIALVSNRGAYVSKLPPDEIAEVYDLLSLLEGYGAELAAQRITAEELECLKRIQHKLITYTEKKKFRDYMEKNDEFHHFLTQFSANKTLVKTVSELRARIYSYRLNSVIIPGYMENYVSDHEKIIEALGRRDAVKARKYMKGHVQFVKEILVGFLRENPGF